MWKEAVIIAQNLHVRTERYYNSLEKYLNLSLLEY
jgi:hypothetical protein